MPNVPGAEAVSEFTDKSSFEVQNLGNRKMWIRSTKPLMAFAPCYRQAFRNCKHTLFLSMNSFLYSPYFPTEIKQLFLVKNRNPINHIIKTISVIMLNFIAMLNNVNFFAVITEI